MSEREFFDYADSTPREILGFVKNGWLYDHEIEKARELSATGTDEECSDYLTRLRRAADRRLGMWRWSQ
jgi:hypothetical protein